MDSISLDSVALEQLHGEQKALLDAIDDLRKHGIGRFVDLPQIIVVGDQSSGKSSVLEAISRVRFPVKDGLCTRFATELVLRTDSHIKVDVRILPQSAPNKATYKFDERSFKKADLPRIVEEAKKQMLEGDAGFSEDVLRIEITSPDVPHLTMVDLPGFYHSEDENQSAAGRIIVDRLAERYMARKNSIILAVISARNQVILQKVLSKVKHHDKHKERTIGIITKPDILTPGTQDEANFIRLAKNLDRSHELSLGWHVLRNRGEMETSSTDEERDEKETKFFEDTLWSSVPSKNRGVAALRKKLSGILLQHIKNNLQGLIESIEDNINSRKAQLERLGDPRSTPRELRTHLDKIASQFHILCLHAVEGNYVDEFFGGLYPGTDATAIDDNRVRKLRAFVRDLNRAFAYVLETKGSRRIILPKSPNNGDNTRLFGSSTLEGQSGRLAEKLTLPTFLLPLVNQYKFKDPEKVTFEQITSELESLSSANQGTEFPGTSNDRLAVKLFQDQSQPWEEIARCHIRLILDITKAFVEKLVGYLVNPDKRTCSAILTEVVDPFFEEKSSALEYKLQELLRHYKSGYPQPLDAEFRALLTQKRQKNIGVDVIRDLIASRPEFFTEEAHKELMKATQSKTTTEFGVDSLIDKCETYYEMSLRTFVDNVIILAVENCLIRDLPSIFTTTRVNKMEDDELERLASESPEVQTERKELRAEYEALKKGLQICNKFKERKAMPVPSILVEPEVPERNPGAPGTSTKATVIPKKFLRTFDNT
ncbi:P-loop containing nucleoside triphosphate hydrolase protein [Daldinia vernicosa]|uniref:P-loop containing nucleoside triphosphate hydrolase protein n=1 Tax=Daldinia vernicosa TaxID=114800 RepID=UPI0020087AE1|nr:P-loop containing nucleoside triphosphate hydrolase protein [Daldinia vernicosa]KAI0852872.1 P-loop containing nucleoside triphosphate hydrolase protein [Daldinia vernicosa]